MGSLLTGLSPLDHGSVSGSPRRSNADVTTLAEHCGELGLATAGFLDNPWLGEEFGLARGYQTLWRTTDLEDVEGWLDEHADRPFFLHVHLFTPHGPYELREEYAEALGLDLASEAARAHGAEIGARVIQGGEVPTRHGSTVRRSRGCAACTAPRSAPWTPGSEDCSAPSTRAA